MSLMLKDPTPSGSGVHHLPSRNMPLPVVAEERRAVKINYRMETQTVQGPLAAKSLLGPECGTIPEQKDR
ncbi:MAG: hypothetical protein ACJ79G_04405 [Myxococcales bacterium]